MTKIGDVVLVRETETTKELVGNEWVSIRAEKSVKPAIVTAVADDGTADVFVIDGATAGGITVYDDLAEAAAHDTDHAIAAAHNPAPAPAAVAPAPAAAPAAEPATDPRDAELAALRAQVAALQAPPVTE